MPQASRSYVAHDSTGFFYSFHFYCVHISTLDSPSSCMGLGLGFRFRIGFGFSV